MAALLMGAVGIQVIQGGAVQAALPTAAVALGDSFVSGEGAGDAPAVVDASGTAQAFPGWSAPNSNAFFCHRSANASLFKATLPGIQDRFNLACSGGQPADIANPSGARAKGRAVASQLDQLRAVAQTHDIDVVLIGLGSNNSPFTFGDVASKCAPTASSPTPGPAGGSSGPTSAATCRQAPCTVRTSPPPPQVAAATVETTAALRQLLDTLAQIDADGVSTGVVLQDYTNPLPLDSPRHYRDEDRRTTPGTSSATSAPSGTPPAARSTARASPPGTCSPRTSAPWSVRPTPPWRPSSRRRPGVLDVQQAFDGARLCENPGSPAGALATPIRLQDGPTGVVRDQPRPARTRSASSGSRTPASPTSRPARSRGTPTPPGTPCSASA